MDHENLGGTQRRIFEVAKENGDGDKKVFFTEFGLSDMGDKARDERRGACTNSRSTK
ncbi:MAG: hypothetical protein ACLRTQ_06235 [Candidatus Borkfalkia sp.]